MRPNLLGAGILACVVWPGAGLACSQDTPTQFLSTTHECGNTILPPHCLSVLHCMFIPYPSSTTSSLLPIWLNVSSLNPWLSDFHIVQYSGSAGCFLFEVNCNSSCGYARRQSMSTYTSMFSGSESFAYFLIALFVFLVLSCMSSSHILEVIPLSEVSLANMFSHMVISFSV